MRKTEHGFTLVEFLIVVIILGVAASVAIPDLSTSNPKKLELAAIEIADAMRFARSEAMHQNSPRGFRQQATEQRIRVFRPDISTSPYTPVFDIYNPLSKQLYDVSLKDLSFVFADNISLNATYRGTCNKVEDIYFDKNGTPWCTDPENVLLDQYKVSLTADQHSRTVTLHGITGRVTVQ